MKISRRIVAALVPLVVTAAAVSSTHAQNDPSALLEAAATGDLGLVRLLLGTGQSANAADSAGNSVLMFAAANGQADVAAMLVESGADVNAANAEGWTPLMMAALGGHVGVAQGLINNGAELNARAADIGMTPLIMAAASGQTEMVSVLVGNGAPVDDATPDGRTVLMAAAEGGHAECVDALIQHGADPTIEAPGGFTALIAATSHGHTAVAWQLIEAGAFFTTRPDAMPELVSNPDLEVPDSLQSADIQGSVVIQFIIDTAGKVEPASVEIVESPHDGLNEAVTQMFLGAEYKPAQYEGRSVRMRIRQSMSFGG